MGLGMRDTAMKITELKGQSKRKENRVSLQGLLSHSYDSNYSVGVTAPNPSHHAFQEPKTGQGMEEERLFDSASREQDLRPWCRWGTKEDGEGRKGRACERE